MTSTTYHFAKPAQDSHSHLRPRLVTQLQRYGTNGRLQEAVNFFYVNWWASIFSRQIRTFLKPRQPSAGFFLIREDIIQGEVAAPFGSVISRNDGKHHGKSADAILCCGDKSMAFLKNGEGLYRLVCSENQDTAWTWQGSIEPAEDVFELRTSSDHFCLGTLSKKSIQIWRHCSPAAPTSNMVLLSGIWLAHSLGWF